MSGLAGIFKFEPRDRVTREELMELAGGIDRVGPDGGAEHLTCNLGMAYRAFHTTPESYREVQPFVCREFVLTWDGRLDNRQEVRDRVSRKFNEMPTDLDLVAAAYEEWGKGCLMELIGDWALGVWDQAGQELLLARDCFGVRPLFYKVGEDRIAWCSMLHPLVTCSHHQLMPDYEYLAGCICPYPRLGTTPYCEIRAVLPAHFLEVRLGGKTMTRRYWSLNPTARIRYRTDIEYQSHFLELLRNAVRQRLRSDRPILCELSGGLDSGSIACMTELIRKEEGCQEISTLSYYDTDEPSGDERPYITAIEEQLGKAGSHISMSEFIERTRPDAIKPMPSEYPCARPGYFRKFLYWQQTVAAIQERAGARVIFSGLGGDEFLGGVQYEALELLEYLLAGKLISFGRSTLQWSLARGKPISELIGDVWKLGIARQSLESFVNQSKPPNWLRLRSISPDFALHGFTSWRNSAPAHLCAESARYALASLISCIDPPLVGMSEMRYPYLDRPLYSFLAAIPREQVIRPRERRSLMRRSLRGLVPDRVLFRKSKWFGHRNAVTFLRDQGSSLDEMFAEPWESDGILFEVAQIRERLSLLQRGAAVEGLQLTNALGIEQWMRNQAARGIIGSAHSQARNLARA